MTNDTVIERKSSSANWAWMLLLPLFFIFGWFTNDAINGSNNTVGQDGQPTYGVGGGPGTFNSPTPNSVDTLNNRIETFPPEAIPSATDAVTSNPTASPSPTSRAQSSPAITATPEIEPSPAP